MGKILDILRFIGLNFENLPNLSLISSFGPGWLLGGLATVALSIFGLSIGRTRAVISLLSIYVAFVFDRIFPYLDEIHNITGDSLEKYWLRFGIFIAIYLVVFFIFNFSFIKRRVSMHEYSLFGIIILSVVQLGFVTSIFFNIVPNSLALKLSSWFYEYFVGQQVLFLWAIAPLPVVLFMGKK